MAGGGGGNCAAQSLGGGHKCAHLGSLFSNCCCSPALQRADQPAVAAALPAPLPFLLQVLVQAGAYVKDDACRALILLVVNAAQLHGYAVRAAYCALAASLDRAQASLLQVTTWCLGEYGELLVGPEAGKLLEGEAPLAVSEADVVGMLEAVVQVS